MTSITSVSSGAGSRRRLGALSSSSRSADDAFESRVVVALADLSILSRLGLSRASRFGAGFSAMFDGESSSSAAIKSIGPPPSLAFLAFAFEDSGLLAEAVGSDSLSAGAATFLAGLAALAFGLAFFTGAAAAGLPRGFHTWASASPAGISNSRAKSADNPAVNDNRVDTFRMPLLWHTCRIGGG
jgi:hypothetical protein